MFLQVSKVGHHPMRVFVLQDDSDVTALCFAPDGQTLYSCSRSLILRSWNVEATTCTRSWKVMSGSDLEGRAHLEI